VYSFSNIPPSQEKSKPFFEYRVHNVMFLKRQFFVFPMPSQFALSFCDKSAGQLPADAVRRSPPHAAFPFSFPALCGMMGDI
jgi:hypothetical protein